MSIHPLAGKPAPKEILTNISRLVTSYYSLCPDPLEKDEQVAFGTSGHRGTSMRRTFNENHILATTQAICDYRVENGVTGPLFMGMDTHALSEPAFASALEVLIANGVTVMIDDEMGYTPTPVISHAILTYNEDKTEALSDGIVITPSHNPPTDGGFKYNPTNGGPADTNITSWIADKANAYLMDELEGVKWTAFDEAFYAPNCVKYDFITPYVADLENVIDMDVIKESGLSIGADAMGGAGLAFWQRIADHYGLKMEVMNNVPDATFSFMSVDKDGKIRMDCSSPYAMAGLIQHKDRFDIAFGNDADFDRHGIVTPSVGLMNPNHYLAVAINYLFNNRDWPKETAIGKTLVSSTMIDHVAKSLDRDLKEVPVGFKWFVDGLVDGSYGFGGEESAGASFLRKNGKVWTTDKDGIILCLLAAEITAKTGRDPGMHYQDLVAQFGSPIYERMDAPATKAQKEILKNLSPEQVSASTLAGDPITAKLTAAPGNGAALGGLKVCTEFGWFAARPSGTEEIYKIYAESFKGKEHLAQIQKEAKEMVDSVLG